MVDLHWDGVWGGVRTRNHFGRFHNCSNKTVTIQVEMESNEQRKRGSHMVEVRDESQGWYMLLSVHF